MQQRLKFTLQLELNKIFCSFDISKFTETPPLKIGLENKFGSNVQYVPKTCELASSSSHPKHTGQSVFKKINHNPLILSNPCVLIEIILAS